MMEAALRENYAEGGESQQSEKGRGVWEIKPSWIPAPEMGPDMHNFCGTPTPKPSVLHNYCIKLKVGLARLGLISR